MYFVYYGDQFLHDPLSEDRRVHDGKLSGDVNTYLQLEFTVPPTNPLIKSLVKRDYEKPIIATFDDQALFRGYIENTQEQMNTEVKVTCKGDLAMLADTVVRPYTTSADDIDPGKTYVGGSRFEHLFKWFIDQHNINCIYKGSDGKEHGKEKQFEIRYPSSSNTSLAHECEVLDSRGDNYRSSTSKPTTLSEIQDKILDSLGAYLQLWYDGDTKCLALYADVPDILKNSQPVEFGVNMTDYEFENSCLNTYTAIRPEGGNDDDGNSVNISSIPDGVVSKEFYKRGDVIYHMANAEKYGYREYAWSNSDVKDPNDLLANSLVELQGMMSSTQSINVSAMDMVFTSSEYKHLLPGRNVTVLSYVHGIDIELMVSSCDIDFDSPGNTKYTMGASASRITKTYSSIMTEIKETQQTAEDADKNSQAAGDKADNALDAATSAAETANKANENSESALVGAQTAMETANNATNVSVEEQSPTIEPNSTEETTEIISGSGISAVYAYMASTGNVRQINIEFTPVNDVQSGQSIGTLRDAPSITTEFGGDAHGSIDTNGTLTLSEDVIQGKTYRINAFYVKGVVNG